MRNSAMLSLIFVACSFVARAPAPMIFEPAQPDAPIHQDINACHRAVPPDAWPDSCDS